MSGLILDHAHGTARQVDRSRGVEYGAEYFAKYLAYEGTPISGRINRARVAITSKYCTSLLDVGIGSGEFITMSTCMCCGYDVNLTAIEWLKDRGLFCDPYASFPEVDGVTLWDVIEHLPEPGDLLGLVPGGAFVFVSTPIFDRLEFVPLSKHFRPDEHFWYWTPAGLVYLFAGRGFTLVEESDAEMVAGREAIGTFVFQKS